MRAGRASKSRAKGHQGEASIWARRTFLRYRPARGTRKEAAIRRRAMFGFSDVCCRTPTVVALNHHESFYNVGSVE